MSDGAGLDRWRLAAVDSAAGACRSVILGLALIEVHAWLYESCALGSALQDLAGVHLAMHA